MRVRVVGDRAGRYRDLEDLLSEVLLPRKSGASAEEIDQRTTDLASAVIRLVERLTERGILRLEDTHYIAGPNFPDIERGPYDDFYG